MRVLHLPKSTGGNAWNLCVAERALGIESQMLCTNNHKYNSDDGLNVDWLSNKFTYPFKAAAFYMKELKNYDILHFNAGSTLFTFNNFLMNMPDLRFLKKTHVKIVVTYQGSDARQAKYCMDNHEINYFRNFPPDKLEKEYNLDSIKISRIKLMDKYADQIYGTNPDLMDVLPKRAIFRPYTKLQIEEWEPRYSTYTKETLTIVHAPTNRLIKGTDTVVSVVNKLISEGLKIELKLIENMANDEAIEMYKTADIGIDQLYAGWYGGFAVELMALGKPVIAYIRKNDLHHIPSKMAKELPIINANTDSLYRVLKELATNRQRLAQFARQSRRYVENWHDSKKIASGIIENYRKLLYN